MLPFTARGEFHPEWVKTISLQVLNYAGIWTENWRKSSPSPKHSCTNEISLAVAPDEYFATVSPLNPLLGPLWLEHCIRRSEWLTPVSWRAWQTPADRCRQAVSVGHLPWPAGSLQMNNLWLEPRGLWEDNGGQDIGMCKSMQRKVHKGQCRGFDVGWCRKLKRTLIRTWGRSLKAGSSIWSVWYEAISTWWLLRFTMFMSEWESVCALVSLVLCVDKYVQPPNIV